MKRLSPKSLFVAARNLVAEARTLPGLVWRYPLGILQEGFQAFDEPQLEENDVPVILIHGFFHNRSGFFVMRRHLTKQGFRKIYTFNYNTLTKSIEQSAEDLAEKVEEVLLLTRRERVHIVGHSQGGLIARYYIQALGGEHRVSKCVTMGTPHLGTYAAYLVTVPASVQMRPNSRFLDKLNALPTPKRVRWYSFYSRNDVLVYPYKNALLPEDKFNVINFNMDDQGHLSFLMSPEAIDTLAEYLRDI